MSGIYTLYLAALADDPETVVMSVDMAHAFNSIHRAAMFAAVQQSAPALPPMVQWAYGDESPLHIVWAPEGTHSVMSQRGVRQSNPLGPPLFALTLQPVMRRVDAACEEAPPVMYLDAVNIVGKLTPAASSFRRLCVDDDGFRSIGLEPLLPSAASTEATRSWSPARLPSYGSRTSLTASPRLTLL